ncbi:MAG: Fic family protein [Myxococcales bacterium]|nr:Fic family protein [Myxococcales bacterium]
MRVRPGSIEEKIRLLQSLETQAAPAARAELERVLDMSWIHHDSALEGIVYDPNELQAALSNATTTDSSLLPIYDEIRQFKAAIDLVRDLASKKREEITLDTIKNIYAELAPEEVEGKQPPKYRKDMPLHRVYFHEIAAPDKIAYKMRQLLQWLQTQNAKRTSHPIRVASKAHYTLLHIFPYPRHSGKVARLLMNLLLLREGYPPAILHATDRQRYYDALKTSSDAVAGVVQDALDNAVDSGVRYWQRQLGIADAAEA